MTKPSFWNGERTASLKRMWELGLPVAHIAEELGGTTTGVRAKASDLHLGLHPDSRERRPHRTKGATIMSHLAEITQEEDAPVSETVQIKLPRLRFLERKFDWERV